MGLFGGIDISGSALSAERLRMDVTAENLANAHTTHGPNGGPYRRKVVILAPGGAGFGSELAGAMGARGGGGPAGVQVAGVVEDHSPDRLVYDPGHPDADALGYVRMPNVDPVSEMVDLITASRGYEANVTAMQAAKAMFTKTLEILR